MYKVDYDNFNFLRILREELEIEKQLISRGAGPQKDDEEGDQERFMKEMEEREQEVREEVARLVDKKALDEMPQMRFRRLMNDDDILGELSKYILDQIYQGDMGGGNIKVGDMKDILKTIDKTLYL